MTRESMIAEYETTWRRGFAGKNRREWFDRLHTMPTHLLPTWQVEVIHKLRREYNPTANTREST